jgi:cytochrome c biogenesis protein CcdA
MTDILFTLTMSLFDSLSTTLQIIIFTLLLTTEKPVRNAVSYLAGLSGAYIACGIGGYLALDELRQFLSEHFPSQTALPNSTYYQSEFLMGLVMVALGFWYFYRKQPAKKGRVWNWFLTKLRNMNIWFACGLGIFISVTSFPSSFQYILALSRYSTLHLDFPAVTGWILFYNFGYALPMILIGAVYLAARRKMGDDHDKLHEHANRLNVHLTAWTMAGFGLFSMIDAGCYFAIGHALVKGRYF